MPVPPSVLASSTRSCCAATSLRRSAESETTAYSEPAGYSASCSSPARNTPTDPLATFVEPMARAWRHHEAHAEGDHVFRQRAGERDPGADIARRAYDAVVECRECET